jgi:2-oxoglutarate ferredoxin oxidoreductase subunit gamma
LYPVPALSVAEELKRRVVANIVVLGFFAEKTKVVGRDALLKAVLNRYPKAADLNRKAFSRGVELAAGLQEVVEVAH